MTQKLRKYCAECGTPVPYSLESKPKFCPECGSSMFGSNASEKKKSPRLRPKKVVDGEVQDIDLEDMTHDMQEWHGTSMSSLDVESNVQRPLSFRLGDLMPSPEEDEKESS